MRLSGSGLTISATDLSAFLACRHRTALDLAEAHGERKRPHFDDPLLDALWKRGAEHEKRYVDALRQQYSTVVDLSHYVNPNDRLAATREEMGKGTDVIVQGALSDPPWFGYPDIMQRVTKRSTLGDWSYEIADTKLARDTRAGTILQLGLYSEMLAVTQGTRPEYFYVVTPDPVTPIHQHRVDDYAAYFRFVRNTMLEAVALGHVQLAEDNYPNPVDHCEICHWNSMCRDRRRADDHLSLVANITAAQRRELEGRSVDTLSALAALPLPIQFKPRRGSKDSYTRVREQARLQHESRGLAPPLHQLLLDGPKEGLGRLPEPSPGDLFLDLEGDPFAVEGGREYLFGIATAAGQYHSRWAFTDHDERLAFEWAIDLIVETARAHPGMHVYHYAPYEPAAFKRLMGRYATRERELDTMLRSGRFVDLYAVVRRSLIAGIERYSIKTVEPLYGFQRDVDLRDATKSLRAMELGLEMGSPDQITPEIREVVEGYNRDDCVSTRWLRDWLETVRDGVIASGTEVPRPAIGEGEAPPDVDERAKTVENLRARLLDGIPETQAERTEEQQAHWLLAYMLDYHRREDKQTWFTYFALCDMTPEELLDEREAVSGLEFVERVDTILNKKTKKPTGSVVDRYRYPAQELEIDRRDKLVLQDQTDFGTVADIDRAALTIDVRKGPSQADTHPTAMFAFSYVPSKAMEGALLRIGESVAAGRSDYGAARALLVAEPPRTRSEPLIPAEREMPTELAVRVVNELDHTTLAIQGPPGAGKTFTGARMICALVKAGKKVGVTSTSHKVIRNLLDAVADAADKTGQTVRIAHKCEEGDDNGGAPRVTVFSSNDAPREALTANEIDVLGGTAWLWARDDFVNAVDVLFVDEAGQMALANVVAVSQAANSLVLLGDPQQLEQPRQGSHPDGVDVSALEHILRGHQTIPADRGIFLPITWRLAPAICAFTSELFYEGRLHSRDGLERQRLVGVPDVPDSGLALVDVKHSGNRNFSSEEIDVVVDLVKRLTTQGASWINDEGVASQLVGSDILIVAPYNAQVTRLSETLAGTGVRVGTVDKFQGQEAPVVIYSMAASTPEDAPRGMEFLYSLNRLNVATSRARCLAILVASPRLFEPECRSPRQMKLANGLCRFREMAAITEAK